MKNRAYSVLNVKSIDAEQRTISGIATTPEVDRAGDIVVSTGVKYKNPLPLLWQHNHSLPVGTVEFGTPTQKGVPFTAKLPNIEESGTLKDRVDEAWQSVKSGLVTAVSIGFRPFADKIERLKGGGIKFLETEVFELSLVTIPANAGATISQIKSIDDKFLAATGPKKHVVARLNDHTGATVSTKKTTKSHAPVEGNTMNLEEQIKNFNATRLAKATEMSEIMEKSAEAGTTLDAEQTEAYDTLADEVKAIDQHVKRLEDMRKLNLEKATPVTDQSGMSARVPVKAKNTEKLEPGIEFARYAMCLVEAKGDTEKALRVAKTNYGQNERIIKTLEFQNDRDLRKVMKAAVEAGTTLDETYAAPLVDYQNFAGDFVEYLRPQTIVGQFGTNGVPALNRIPFNVRIAGQTSGGAGYWVGEGAPKPLTAFDFTATELRWNKVANIAVLTEELIRFSNPSAERLVRDALAGALIERIDIDFIDPSNTAVTNVRPASITNGATEIPSTGTAGDADSIRADIQALWAPFIAARNPPRSAVYIMDSTTALALSMMRNPLGQGEFPGLTMNGGMFMGVPVIVSDYLPVDSTGGMIVLLNARDVWLADDGQVTIDASREASLQMDNAPTNNSATATGSTMVSMYQTNSVALRAERYINWARRRDSGVAYLSGVDYS